MATFYEHIFYENYLDDRSEIVTRIMGGTSMKETIMVTKFWSETQRVRGHLRVLVKIIIKCILKIHDKVVICFTWLRIASSASSFKHGFRFQKGWKFLN
jgi:hypothetical protein